MTVTSNGNATCPRCAGRFACMAGTGMPCHCGEVALNAAQRAYIAAHWDGCLCHRCLLAVKHETTHLAEEAG